jgi:hypothetical protein
MAVLTFTGASVLIAGTDISDHVKEVTIDDGREENDDTTVNMTAKSLTGGLPTPSVTLKIRQDYASAKTHALIRAAVNIATAVVIRPVAATIRSATNPDWQFTGKVLRYQPIAGTAGQFQELTVKFEPTGTPLSELTTAT